MAKEMGRKMRRIKRGAGDDGKGGGITMKIWENKGIWCGAGAVVGIRREGSEQLVWVIRESITTLGDIYEYVR